MTDGPDVLRRVLGDDVPDVSRETLDRLHAFQKLLEQWQRRMNLVGPDTLPRFWSHHVADGAFAYRTAPDAGRWIDLGAGAGLPGLVIAMLAAGDGRRTRVDLVEANARKCAFQRAAVLETGLRAGPVAVAIHPVRIEAFAADGPHVLTARALAPLDRLLDHMRTLGSSRALFLKGERYADEIEAARRRHRFDVAVHEHPLRRGSVLLDVRPTP